MYIHKFMNIYIFMYNYVYIYIHMYTCVCLCGWRPPGGHSDFSIKSPCRCIIHIHVDAIHV